MDWGVAQERGGGKVKDCRACGLSTHPGARPEALFSLQLFPAPGPCLVPLPTPPNPPPSPPPRLPHRQTLSSALSATQTKLAATGTGTNIMFVSLPATNELQILLLILTQFLTQSINHRTRTYNIFYSTTVTYGIINLPLNTSFHSINQSHI